MAQQKLRKYELIFLVQPEATDEEREKVETRLQGVFESEGVVLIKREDWGKRKLAYEIRKHNKAFYHYLVFACRPGVTAEIERVLRMLDACVRFQHIKLEDGIDPDTVTQLIEEPEGEDAPEVVPEAAATEQKKEAPRG